jgi:hypothetical protein
MSVLLQTIYGSGIMMLILLSANVIHARMLLSEARIIAAIKDNGCASHYPFSETEYSTEVLNDCPNLNPNQKGKNHE